MILRIRLRKSVLTEREKTRAMRSFACCFDNSRELDEDDYALIESAKLVPSIAVINKTDLDNKLDIEYISKNIKYIVYISAISGDGRDELTKAVEKSQELKTLIRVKAFSQMKDSELPLKMHLIRLLKQ